jgi:hypothetical protein
MNSYEKCPFGDFLEPAILRGEAFGGGDGVAVEFGCKLGLSVVAATVEDGNGDAVFDHGAQQDFVTALDFFQGQVHLTKAVIAMIVGTRNPNHQIWDKLIE